MLLAGPPVRQMVRNLFRLLGPVLAVLMIAPAWADRPDPQRGWMLYENQCVGCHESQVHIREDHRAGSLAEVWWQTIRWSRDLRLGWRHDEFADVSLYLYRQFYQSNPNAGGGAMNMTLTSSAFTHNGSIPARFTCEGEDLSPELTWSELPEGTRSLALIVDDPDAPDPAAPRMTWVHWVLYNIPPDSGSLPESAHADNLPEGTLEGLNDWKRTGYGGPCPPIGRHRYFHKLYALDTLLPDLKQPTKAQLEKALQGHILGYTELVGTYQKK